MRGSETSPSLHSSFFTNPKHTELFNNDFSLRKLETSYALDLQWFQERKGFDFIEWLNHHKLLKFLTTTGPIAPILVRAFYTTFEYNSVTETITAELKGTKIHLSLSQLSAILDLSCEGEKMTPASPPTSWSELNLEEACSSICHASANIKKRPILAGSLSTQNRLLIYIITRIILPKASNVAQVSLDEVILLWGIKQKKKINWGHLIVSHMKKLKDSNDKGLPYSILVTKIIQHCGISIIGERVSKERDAYHMINSSTINQMKYIQTGDLWHHADIGIASAQEYDPNRPPCPDTPEPDQPEQNNAAASFTSSALTQFLSALNLFQEEHQTMYEEVKKEIIISREKHSQDIAELKDQLTELELHVTSLSLLVQNP